MVGQVSADSAGAESGTHAAEILDQGQTEHDRDCPQFAQVQGTDRLVGCDETGETLRIHPSISVRDRLQRDLIYPRKPGGGAIEQVDTGAASPAMMTLNDCNFVNNHADAGSGGAIYNIYYGLSDTPSTITANGCTFDGNQALWGGAIYSEGDLGIKDSAFNNNHAEWGGAIESTWGTATIEDSDFTDNYAELGGGAVLSTDGTNEPRTMTLNECTFTNNHVNDGDGGAVMNVYTGYAATSPVIIADGCTFDGNTATGNGGAYAAINYGGAGAPGTVNIITGSDFQNNVAGGKGNAFYAQTPSTNTFIGNTYGPDQDIVIE